MGTSGKLAYLCGPMTGIKDYNFPAFKREAKRLRKLGHKVFNPAETFGGDKSVERETYMAVDLAVLAVCDFVVVLPGWEDSEGCNIEVRAAQITGKKVYAMADMTEDAVV